MNIEEMPIHAAFVICPSSGDLLAATTRLRTLDDKPQVGFPGGKLEPGETAREAVERESKEEGWDVYGLAVTPFYTAIVDEKRVVWFRADYALLRHDYKEMGRIAPVSMTPQLMCLSGMGNKEAVNKYLG